MAKQAHSLGYGVDTQNIMYEKYGVDHFIKDMETYVGIPSEVLIPLMAKRGILHALAVRDAMYGIESELKRLITSLNTRENGRLTTLRRGELRAFHALLADIKKITKSDRWLLPSKSARNLKKMIAIITTVNRH